MRHGVTQTAEWVAWSNMRNRCFNARGRAFAYHGARGITVCERWGLFENFLADMGPRPSPKHSLDRIDNDGNYEPGNCRWATVTEQANNTRHNRIIEIDGARGTRADWARLTGVKANVVGSRLHRGWSERRALGLEP